MDLSAVRTLTLDTNFSVFGVDVMVLTPDRNTPTAARGIWLTNTTEDRPGANPFPRKEARRAMALRRSEVPDLPRNTVITAPGAAGEDEREWRVDGVEQLEAEHWRVVVVPHREE